MTTLGVPYPSCRPVFEMSLRANQNTERLRTQRLRVRGPIGRQDVSGQCHTERITCTPLTRDLAPIARVISH